MQEHLPQNGGERKDLQFGRQSYLISFRIFFSFETSSVASWLMNHNYLLLHGQAKNNWLLFEVFKDPSLLQTINSRGSLTY